jgi:hypothetical protein
MSKWSRKTADAPRADPHLPVLRETPDHPLQQDNKEKTRILAEKFFSSIEQADLSDIDGESQPLRNVELDPYITKEGLEEVIRGLLSGRAPRPDRIPNEVLKILIPEISTDLVLVISRLLASGSLPSYLKESTTIALRKDGKKDYSLPSSYRPIALENTLAKAIEKIIANRISTAAETKDLLP